MPSSRDAASLFVLRVQRDLRADSIRTLRRGEHGPHDAGRLPLPPAALPSEAAMAERTGGSASVCNAAASTAGSTQCVAAARRTSVDGSAAEQLRQHLRIRRQRSDAERRVASGRRVRAEEEPKSLVEHVESVCGSRDRSDVYDATVRMVPSAAYRAVSLRLLGSSTSCRRTFRRAALPDFTSRFRDRPSRRASASIPECAVPSRGRGDRWRAGG